jgi:thiol-disulfide isomerase/thioredoxin
MKCPIPALPVALAAILLTSPAFAQKAGDSVTPDALGKLQWMQGTAPAAWEPGKVYVLECWATWCGPCVAVIPHVDALYDKYEAKGLRVIGVNVWEDGAEKVTAFLKKKGDGMSYPVAYTGKGGVFETEWLKPAGVKGIPHAFVVKNGKVLFTTHPSQLTGSLVESLLAGGEAETKAVATINEAAQQREQLSTRMRAFQAAAQKNDADGMAKVIAELEPLTAAASYLPSLRLQLMTAKSDWPGIAAALEAWDAGPIQPMTLTTLAQKAIKTPEMPDSLRRTIATQYAVQLKERAHPVQLQSLARLQWNVGDKEASLATSRRALEVAESEDGLKMRVPANPFKKWVEALEKGEVPDEKTFAGWYRESQPAARTATEK